MQTPTLFRVVSRALKIKANKLEKKVLICDYEPLMKIAEPENGELLVIRDPKGDLERGYDLWEKTYCIDMSWVFKDFRKNHR